MEPMLSMHRPLGRMLFFFNTLVVAMASVSLGIVCFTSLAPKHGFFPLACFTCLVIGVVATLILLTQVIRRLKDLERPGLWSLWMFVPGANVLLWLMLIFAPGKH